MLAFQTGKFEDDYDFVVFWLLLPVFLYRC